jgi:hypothetical protein
MELLVGVGGVRIYFSQIEVIIRTTVVPATQNSFTAGTTVMSSACQPQSALY